MPKQAGTESDAQKLTAVKRALRKVNRLTKKLQAAEEKLCWLVTPGERAALTATFVNSDGHWERVTRKKVASVLFPT